MLKGESKAARNLFNLFRLFTATLAIEFIRKSHFRFWVNTETFCFFPLSLFIICICLFLVRGNSALVYSIDGALIDQPRSFIKAASRREKDLPIRVTIVAF